MGLRLCRTIRTSARRVFGGRIWTVICRPVKWRNGKMLETGRFPASKRRRRFAMSKKSRLETLIREFPHAELGFPWKSPGNSPGNWSGTATPKSSCCGRNWRK